MTARSDPTDWRNIGDLADLLDERGRSELLRQAGMSAVDVRPDYLRLKPAESALIGLQTVLPGSGTDGQPWGYLRTFADGERAAAVFEKWQRKKVIDHAPEPGIALLGRTIVHRFPNDAALHGLARVADGRRWKSVARSVPALALHRLDRAATTAQVAAYKPERRLVTRAELHLRTPSGGEEVLAIYARLTADRSATRLSELAGALFDSGAPVPRPVGVGLDGRIALEHAVRGADGVDAVLDGTLDLDAVVAALDAFRQLPSGRLSLLPAHDAGHHRAGALAALDLVAMISPELAWPATRVALSLRRARMTPQPVDVAHGDLHLHQILAGTRAVTLVDLERMATAPLVGDLATLLAHLIDLAIRLPAHRPRLDRARTELHRSWLRRFGRNDHDLGAFLACALVQRVLLAFRTFDRDANTVGAALLDEAADAVGAPHWEVIHARPSGSWSGRSGRGRATQHLVLEPGAMAPRKPAEDTDLPGLRPLAHGSVLAYRPGRRAVVRFGSDGPFLKVVRPRRTAALVERHTALLSAAAGTLAPRMPAIEAVDLAFGTVELEALPGEALSDALLNVDRRRRRASLAVAATMLERFHGIDGDLLRQLGPPSAGGHPTEWFAALATIHPGLQQLHRPVLERLVELDAAGDLVGPATSAVHGDLHDRNVLLDGEQGALIDLDGAGFGDPAIDTGNLAAHVFLRALQRGDTAREGRDEAGVLLGRLPHEGRAVLQGASTLYRLSVLYRMRPRSARHCATLLSESWRWATDGP